MPFQPTRMHVLFLIAAFSAASFIGDANAAEQKLTGKNTKITFVGGKPDGSTHSGTFKELTGAIEVPSEDVTQAKLNVTIKIESMETDNERLTGHLLSPDFFEARRYPEAKFVSKSIEKTDDGYMIVGELTMRGVTKPLKFPAKITVEGDDVTLSSKFELDRTQWEIVYGKGQINDAVKMAIEVKK